VAAEKEQLLQLKLVWMAGLECEGCAEVPAELHFPGPSCESDSTQSLRRDRRVEPR
jgi:hypothetical protein